MSQVVRKVLPLPLHSLVLFTVWLLLNSSADVSTITVAVFLALFIPILLSPFCVPLTPIKKPMAAVVYLFKLLLDIIVSCIQVSIQVMSPVSKLTPGFIKIPLDMSDEFPITVLSSSISLTPGTVSVDVSMDKQFLYVHVLHMDDEAALVAHIKRRYETPLKEIFQC